MLVADWPAMASESFAKPRLREEDDERQTRHDSSIGEIERRPVMVAPVNFDQIPHEAKAKPVEDVAERAADGQAPVRLRAQRFARG